MAMTEQKAVYKARRGVSKPQALSTGADGEKTPQKAVQRKSAAFKLKAQSPDEAMVLNAVLRYLKIERRVAWSHRMNSGATTIPGGPGRKPRFLRFGFVGCPDILGQMIDGRLLAIECKKPGGKKRDQQVEFVALALAHGAVACFADSVDQVKAAIDEAYT